VTFNDSIVEAVTEYHQISGGGVGKLRKFDRLARFGTFVLVAGVFILLSLDFPNDGTAIYLPVLFLILWIVMPLFMRMQKKRTDERAAGIIQSLALKSGGKYFKNGFGVWVQEKGALFKQGYENYLDGVEVESSVEGRRRFMFYKYTTGDKSRVTHHYFLYGVRAADTFPHMYLNYRKNSFLMNLGEFLSLPAEFEKEYSLSIAPGYHVEALSVFTPDILALLLDLPYKCDVEIVDGEMLFIIESAYNIIDGDHMKLEQELKGIESIIGMLRPKIERTSWAPIGDKPHHIGAIDILHTFK
jgi:hypothetical protein